MNEYPENSHVLHPDQEPPHAVTHHHENPDPDRDRTPPKFHPNIHLNLLNTFLKPDLPRNQSVCTNLKKNENLNLSYFKQASDSDHDPKHSQILPRNPNRLPKPVWNSNLPRT